ncbi:hypothetical protein D7X98_07975 [bacterium 1XD8-76]|nr:hypothetical protein D7X98_07975 [bacterium 1XD8-76]
MFVPEVVGYLYFLVIIIDPYGSVLCLIGNLIRTCRIVCKSFHPLALDAFNAALNDTGHFDTSEMAEAFAQYICIYGQ